MIGWCDNLGNRIISDSDYRGPYVTFAENTEGIKPFVSSKYRKSDDIILEENGMIISEKEYVADIFNNYFSKVAEGLEFNDPIPNDYHDDDILLSAIKIRQPP